MSQDWRIETNAEDYLRFQKKRLNTEERRPLIRRPADLVGPGIGSNAVQVTNWNDPLATFNGYYSSVLGDVSAPTTAEVFVGYVTSDAIYGGTQNVTGLSSGMQYSRIFVRNAADPASVGFEEWVPAISETSIGRLEEWPQSMAANTWISSGVRNGVFRGDRIDSPAIGVLRVLRDGWYEVGAQCGFDTIAVRCLMRINRSDLPDEEVLVMTEGGGTGGALPALNGSTVVYLQADTRLRMFMFSSTANTTLNKYFYAREV